MAHLRSLTVLGVLATLVVGLLATLVATAAPASADRDRPGHNKRSQSNHSRNEPGQNEPGQNEPGQNEPGQRAGQRASAPAPLVNAARPRIKGTIRFGQTLRADRGRWRPTVSRVRYQWLVGGSPVRGATRKTYLIRPEDVGRRVIVEVTAYAPGHSATKARSRPRGAIKHRVDVRRTVTYSVSTKGRVTASLRDFRRLAQQTYDDPRGWRAKGVRFKPVSRGGSFTLWLAEASTVPGFSSACSSEWSCRVGRNVIINQTRWQQASPAWNGAGRSLRDYRHMVVNHETGHWLGRGHAGCPGRGQSAPVMMQQSKGTQGCRFNPWPTRGELGR